MKRTTSISIAALLGTTLLAAPAIAQVGVDAGGGVNAETGVGANDGGVGVEGGVDAEVGVGSDGAEVDTDVNLSGEADAGVDDETTASIGANFDGALSAIGSNNADAISTMTEISSVNIIRIDSLEGADMASLDAAVDENNAQIEDLHAALEGNAELRAQLEQQGVDPRSVVAADVGADGSLDIYVR